MQKYTLSPRLKSGTFSLIVALPFLLACSSSLARTSSSGVPPFWIVPDDTGVTTLGPCPILRKQFVVEDVPGTARARVIGLAMPDFSAGLLGAPPFHRLGDRRFDDPFQTLRVRGFDRARTVHLYLGD